MIPITEKWLIKSKLTPRPVNTRGPGREYIEYSIRNEFEIYCYMDTSGNCLFYGECIEGEDFPIIKCDSVHVFQNIFSLLSGEKLKIPTQNAK